MGLKVYVTHRVSENTMYIFAQPEYVGNFHVKKPMKSSLDKKTRIIKHFSEDGSVVKKKQDYFEVETECNSEIHIREDNLAFRKVTYGKEIA